jgi:hypothetical protein
VTAIRKVNHKHTLMTATCHGCGRAWRATEGTGADELGVVNLRRRIKDHARQTGHEIVFNERRLIEGRVCAGG